MDPAEKRDEFLIGSIKSDIMNDIERIKSEIETKRFNLNTLTTPVATPSAIYESTPPSTYQTSYGAAVPAVPVPIVTLPYIRSSGTSSTNGLNSAITAVNEKTKNEFQKEINDLKYELKVKKIMVETMRLDEMKRSNCSTQSIETLRNYISTLCDEISYLLIIQENDHDYDKNDDDDYLNETL